MKTTLSWLKEFIDLNQPPHVIAKTLTSLGIEVDGIENRSPAFSNVVVAKVISTEPHPNADKLCIAQVDAGGEVFQVVCGASNCRAGLKTALALIGAEIGTGQEKFKIKRSKIRGVESFGMLCSKQELGLEESSEGIIEFQDSMKEGFDLASLYSDTIFELSLTPNLSHCLSIKGIARELSAAFSLKLKSSAPSVIESETPNGVQIKIDDLEGCPRYACRVIENIKVGPSPAWLKTRLEAVGLRSINNVVDATNYVMLEKGQPLHPFDLDKVSGQTIIVRQSKAGEKITTLDDKERELEAGILLIADPEKPIAIAGVMGGHNSEVSENTVKVILESAFFSPSLIRKGSKKTGLSTDASRRFERGVDPAKVVEALDQSAQLIAELSGGKVSKGVVEITAKEFKPLTLKCRLSRINNLLGTHLSVGEVEAILTRLDFTVSFDGQNTFEIKVPTYRFDVTQEIDLIEEVARLYGYDNIPRENPKFSASQMGPSQLYLLENEVRLKLVQEGLQEFITCDLIGPSMLKVVQGNEEIKPQVISVLNPVSIEQSILRTSLLPGLLQTVKHNFDRECQDVAGFEIGRIHFRNEGKIKEDTTAALILSGKSSPNFYDPKSALFEFRDIKGILENFLTTLGVTGVSFRKSHFESFHPGRQASIFVGGLEIGSFGEIHPAVQRRLDVPLPILYAELNLTDIFNVRKKEIRMKELSSYPSSERDWTLTLREKAAVNQVIDAIKSIPSKLLEDVYLFDMYRSETLGADNKNPTFRFRYRDKDKTIDQESVDQEHKRLIQGALHLITGCLP